MNRKQLIALLIVGLVLGALGLYVFRSGRSEYASGIRRDGEKLLGDFPTHEITHITIRSATNEVNLVKDGSWVVRERDNYPASFSEIAELVRKLWELKPVQSQSVDSSRWGRLNLLPPDSEEAGTNSATLIVLRNAKGETVRSLLLGKQQMRDSGGQFGGFPVGRWIALPDQKDTVYVVDETFSNVQPSADNWLSRDFFKVEKLKSISLVSPGATNSWSLARLSESGDWMLTDAGPGEEADKSRTSSFNWVLSSPSFNDVQPAGSEKLAGVFADPYRLTLETFDGFRYDIQAAPVPPAEEKSDSGSSSTSSDRYYLTVKVSADLPAKRTPPEGETDEEKEKAEKEWNEKQEKLKEKLKREQALGNWVYTVSKWTLDSVLKDRSALLAEPSETESSSDAPAAESDSSNEDAPESEAPGDDSPQSEAGETDAPGASAAPDSTSSDASAAHAAEPAEDAAAAGGTAGADPEPRADSTADDAAEPAADNP